jgi:non-ribosomal peptide synthetase component E (peptide arylation enzyme)
LGECVTAFIVPAQIGLTEKELERFCLESMSLARFKRPRRLVFVDCWGAAYSSKRHNSNLSNRRMLQYFACYKAIH